MSFNLDTCKWVMWGAKSPHDTFGYVHDAFGKALRFLGKEVLFLDATSDISKIDFENTLFMSMNCVLEGMPRRQDCFYVMHNVLGHPAFEYVKDLRLLPYGIHIQTNHYSSQAMELAPNVFFEPSTPALTMTWGTNLLPHEIEANKPTRVFNEESRVINFVGSIDGTKRYAIETFGRAASENGIQTDIWGGYSGHPVVSEERHVELIKESYLAPAFEEKGQNDTGYISCRLFKNISYGQFGITQSRFANELFGSKLIYGEDPYNLFYYARERMQNMQLSELHSLMDEVAAKHTYLNKIDAIVKAVRILEAR